MALGWSPTPSARSWVVSLVYRRMSAENWPTPTPLHGAMAYERVGWLARKPKPVAAKPIKP